MVDVRNQRSWLLLVWSSDKRSSIMHNLVLISIGTVGLACRAASAVAVEVNAASTDKRQASLSETSNFMCFSAVLGILIPYFDIEKS